MDSCCGNCSRSLDKPAAGVSNPPVGKRPRSNTRELGTDRSKSHFVSLYVNELTAQLPAAREGGSEHGVAAVYWCGSWLDVFLEPRTVVMCVCVCVCVRVKQTADACVSSHVQGYLAHKKTHPPMTLP